MSILFTLNKILFEIKTNKKTPTRIVAGFCLTESGKNHYRLQVLLLKFIIAMGDQSIFLNLFLTETI